MVLVTIFLLCSIVSVAEGRHIKVTLDADQPFMKMEVSGTAILKCCYNNNGNDTVNYSWIITTVIANHAAHNHQLVNVSEERVEEGEEKGRSLCRVLVLKKLRFSDAGLYRCVLNSHGITGVFSHGTFLQVYKPIEKILYLSENVKNNILTAQGILLLLCVLLPGANLLRKSKKIYALEKKKAMRKEENIYEGLKIEDFSSPYDQIQRAPAEVTYEDVCMSECEAHLENP
ncbi:unnamed protein product [Lota lota]